MFSMRIDYFLFSPAGRKKVTRKLALLLRTVNVKDEKKNQKKKNGVRDKMDCLRSRFVDRMLYECTRRRLGDSGEHGEPAGS